MPAATTKDDLLAVTAKEFSKLSALIYPLPPEIAQLKDDEDTSIQDVVAHRAHWIDLFLGWYSDGQADRDVHFPAKDYKWSELKRYNADLRARLADQTWQDAHDTLHSRHDALVAFIVGLGQQDLYGGPMKGARNNWTTGRWAEAAGPAHYRSAAKYIRARLKEAKDAST